MLDNDPATGSNTGSTEPQAISTPAQDINPASEVATPTGTTEPQGQDQSSQTAPTQDGQDALTNQTGPISAVKPATVDWEKKYHETTKGFGRMRNEYGTMRQRLDQFEQNYKGIDPQAITAWKQQQEAAVSAKLPKHNQKHPEHAAFMQTHSEYKRLLQGWQRAESPEGKAAFAAEMERYPADVQQDIAALEAHKRTTVERIASEMEGFGSLDEMIASKTKGMFERERLKSDAETKVNAWFDAPTNKPIIDYTSAALHKALTDGVPLAYAQKMAEDAYKIDAYESRLTNTDQAVAASQARTQAAKANAAITRDTTATAGRRVDPVQVARDRGITDLASGAYVALLNELNSKGLL